MYVSDFRTFRCGLKITYSRRQSSTRHGALESHDLHDDQQALSIKVHLVYG